MNGRWIISLILATFLALAGYSAVHAQQKETPKLIANRVGMKFVWIPAGSFTMGSPNQEKSRGDDEIVRKVTLTRGFYMGVHAVTQEQWQAVMGNNPSEFKGSKNLPVDSVSWDDSRQFCKKLRDKDRRAYRLPTEAEWEYACRAGTTGPFHFGDTIGVEQANYNGNFVYGMGIKGVYRAKTVPVGNFAANAWGLHDMHGNIWQWCQDWHGGYAQKDTVDPQGSKTGKNRVLRGGSWGSHPVFLRSANRNFSDPASRTEFYGLRVCFNVQD
jgi:formylglycine-generating enzyme required for sulfatase activity